MPNTEPVWEDDLANGYSKIYLGNGLIKIEVMQSPNPRAKPWMFLFNSISSTASFATMDEAKRVAIESALNKATNLLSDIKKIKKG